MMSSGRRSSWPHIQFASKKCQSPGLGKTTAVRILATLLPPDGGRASVGGYDVVREAHQVRQLIGLTGQYASVDDGLTGVNNLIMIGRLLGLSRADARVRAAELLERFELTDA